MSGPERALAGQSAKRAFYRAFHGIGQAKFVYSGWFEDQTNLHYCPAAFKNDP